MQDDIFANYKEEEIYIWLVAGLNRYWIIFLWNKEIELRYDFFLFLNNSVHFVDEYFCDTCLKSNLLRIYVCVQYG